MQGNRLSRSASLSRRAFVSLSLMVALGSGIAGAAQARQQSASVVLAGSTPSWANSHNRVGAADPSTSIGFRLYLGWSNAAAAGSLAKAVSNPHS
jgi:hypothetical protein